MKWKLWPLGGVDHCVLVALTGAPVELELWLGAGFTATRARWRLQGAAATLAWVVVGEA